MIPNLKPLCIYHGQCSDGFAAAWVVRRYYGSDEVEFFAAAYNQPPPDVTGREVIMVDFSYKRAVLLEMSSKAAGILIIDHHKTAADDLKDIGTEGIRITAIFDMTRSGAGLTWDAFFIGQRRPKLIDHIEDRDLWLFKLDGTREIIAAVSSYAFNFDTWDQLMAADPRTLIPEGAAIERKHFKDIGELVAVTKRRMKIGGYDVPVANLPYTLASDAGNMMSEGEPFAATYFDKEGARVFSLRSKADGVDVSEVAKLFGGGGHKNAAGFTAASGWEGEQ